MGTEKKVSSLIVVSQPLICEGDENLALEWRAVLLICNRNYIGTSMQSLVNFSSGYFTPFPLDEINKNNYVETFSARQS